jgi:hypothetical protein
VIAAMLAVADSRFQSDSLRQAKDAGKIEARLRAASGVPRQYARSHRARAVARIRAGAAAGVSVRHRFHAGGAAAHSGAATVAVGNPAAPRHPAGAWIAVIFPAPDVRDCLARMALDHPSGTSEHIEAALLKGALMTEAR